MNVCTAAWTGDGSPITPDTTPGHCARCGDPAALTPTRATISKSFTAYDGWSDPSGPGLCPACTWTYTTSRLRSAIHLVTRTPAALHELTRTQTRDLLQSGPLHHDHALVVPLRPGRKHVFATATWGRIATDHAQLSWTETDVELLHLISWLRTLGFGSRMLTAPAPPYAALAALQRTQWTPVIDAWARLDVWRRPDNPWLPLAVHVTTPTKEDR